MLPLLPLLLFDVLALPGPFRVFRVRDRGGRFQVARENVARFRVACEADGLSWLVKCFAEELLSKRTYEFSEEGLGARVVAPEQAAEENFHAVQARLDRLDVAARFTESVRV